MQWSIDKHSHSKSYILVCYFTMNFHDNYMPKKCFVRNYTLLNFFVREPRSCLAGKYSYSIPEFNLGFHFPVLPVSVFFPLPGKFLFLVLPRANPIWDIQESSKASTWKEQVKSTENNYLSFQLQLQIWRRWIQSTSGQLHSALEQSMNHWNETQTITLSSRQLLSQNYW